MNKKNKLIKNKITSSFKKNLMLGCLGLIFLVVNIYFSLQTVSSGSKLASLEKTQTNLVKKNNETVLRLASATSLSTAEKQSPIMGFVDASNVVYVNVNEVVASRLP